MSADAATSFARTLVDEWARRGVTDAVVTPGSRSAPLALALARDGRLRTHIYLDERSAAFFALGLGRATGLPAVVLCTSGTAAANFHPAVLEAHHGRVPLLVCTADRPPELQNVGAAQTIDQTDLFGPATRWATTVAVPVEAPGAGASWRRLAARAVTETIGRLAGPVHLNLSFREPLVPTGEPLIDVAPLLAPPGQDQAGGGPQPGPSIEVMDRVAELVRDHHRGVLVVGWGAAVRAETVAAYTAATGWPVLADAISSVRAGESAISTYDLLANDDAVRSALDPAIVIRLGAPLTGKATTAWLEPTVAERPLVVVDRDPARRGGERAATELVTADPDQFLAELTDQLVGEGPELRQEPDRAWLARWLAVEHSVRRAVDTHLDHDDEPFEGRIARDVMDAVPAGSDLVVASSMPVRDLESFARPRDKVTVHANRGVNGIDGFVSTALGIAAATAATGGAPTVALVGDLCFLHDSNGLAGATGRALDAVFVVVDNNGGGIFSFLAQADLDEHFEQLWGTPHDIDLGALGAVHGIPVTTATRAEEVGEAVRAAVAAGGVRMVHVRTDRATNVARHHAVADVATSAARSVLGGRDGSETGR